MSSSARQSAVLHDALAQLQAEAQGSRQRAKAFFQLIRETGQLHIVLGCDDGRVGVPSTPVDIVMPDGSKRATMMLYLPKIGAGRPDKELLAELVAYVCRRAELSKDNVWILVTQHGSTSEITQTLAGEPVSKVTCGLRGVLQAVKSQFLPQYTQFLLKSARIDAHSYEEILQVKKHGRNELKQDAQALLDILDTLSTSLGGNAVPHRLLVAALLHNYSPDIVMNARRTMTQVRAMQIVDRAHVQLYFFDHDRTCLVDEEMQIVSQLGLSSEHRQDMTFQNPKVACISFGAKAAAIPDSAVFHQTIPMRQVDIGFNSVAAQSVNDLLDSFAEVWYAASHHNAVVKAGRKEDASTSFADLELVIIKCSDQDYVDTALEALRAIEFKCDFQTEFEKLGKVFLCNLENELVQEVKLIKD